MIEISNYIFFSLYEEQFVSIPIRVAPRLILMQYMYMYIYAWSITFEWMNQSKLHERLTEELASISFVSFRRITDGAWLHWTSRRRFNVIFSFSFSLSLSRSLFLTLLSCCYITLCSSNGVLLLLLRSYYNVLICIDV
jgi:hypothetical protein